MVSKRSFVPSIRSLLMSSRILWLIVLRPVVGLHSVPKLPRFEGRVEAVINLVLFFISMVTLLYYLDSFLQFYSLHWLYIISETKLFSIIYTSQWRGERHPVWFPQLPERKTLHEEFLEALILVRSLVNPSLRTVNALKTHFENNLARRMSRLRRSGTTFFLTQPTTSGDLPEGGNWSPESIPASWSALALVVFEILTI